MTIAQLHCPPYPVDFDLSAWRQHAAGLLRTWLTEDFNWGDSPLGVFIGAVTATLDDGTAFPLWGDHPHLASSIPEASIDLEAAEHDPWHPAWFDLVSAPWELKGRWLHPDTCFEIDQFVFAKNGGNLLIACTDRGQPGSEPRLDPTRSPYFTDQGVIATPMFPHRALRYLEAGYTPTEALLLLAGTAVTEFCVHEALETFQNVPGRPVWDPHHTRHSLTIDIHWHAPGTVTQGWPIR